VEASSVAAPGPRASTFDRIRARLSENPAKVFFGVMMAIAIALIAAEGLQLVAQRTVNGLVTGSYFALGAIGLTLVYGILKLVNFAHGEILTLGAYIGVLFHVTLGVPFLLAVLITIALVAAFGVGTELAMWRPMRRRKAGMLQLLLMAIGLAFVLRNGIQFIWGTSPRGLDVDVTGSVRFLGLRIGETELIVVIVGMALLISIALMLRYTALGKQMRALSDDFDLAEVTGIDTDRITLATWIVAAGTVGLAGVLVAMSLGSFTPNTGFFLLLSLFAAVILGGIGNAYGALVGGLVIGLVQEWSTLLVDARWKVLVGFGVLILVLIVRPQGIFGKERTI
jgi:neutral amino acid transport system permease protein